MTKTATDLPQFFNTAMDDSTEYVSHEADGGLYVTSTAFEDGVTLGSVTHGPLVLVAEEEATMLLAALFGTPAPEFQEGEAFEFVTEEGALAILAKLNGELHCGVEVYARSHG